jgi:aspartyl-tRNA(Asn)/glutamyl-tRNA(Gln) amidotransferase subunit C
MALTAEQIDNIAHLAHLALKESEVPVYRQSLSAILEFVGQLNAVATQDVTPMAHPLPGLVQRMRPDEVTEEDKRERYQANAPKVIE